MAKSESIAFEYEWWRNDRGDDARAIDLVVSQDKWFVFGRTHAKGICATPCSQCKGAGWLEKEVPVPLDDANSRDRCSTAKARCLIESKMTLAASSRRRQHAALALTDALAAAIDRRIIRAWRELLRLAKGADSVPDAWRRRHQAHAILWDLFRGIHRQLGDEFGKLAHWGYETAAAGMVEHAPLGTLRRAVDGRARLVRAGGGSNVRPVIHQRGAVRENMHPASRAPDLRTIPVREDAPAPQPGFVQLALDAAGKLAAGASLDRQDLGALLFPPPKIEDVIRILRHPIAGRTWEQDLSLATKLADPNVWLGIVSGGIAAGQTPAQIARTLRPAVDGYKASARRIARTYGMQIAHRGAMEAHDQLGDLLVGYVVHSAKGPYSRKWHVERDGTEYFFRPGPDQKGMESCPHPPLEPANMDGCPAGAPHTAWNCMCWLSPRLRD